MLNIQKYKAAGYGGLVEEYENMEIEEQKDPIEEEVQVVSKKPKKMKSSVQGELTPTANTGADFFEAPSMDATITSD